MSYTRTSLVWDLRHISSRDMGGTWRQRVLELGLLSVLSPHQGKICLGMKSWQRWLSGLADLTWAGVVADGISPSLSDSSLLLSESSAFPAWA